MLGCCGKHCNSFNSLQSLIVWQKSPNVFFLNQATVLAPLSVLLLSLVFHLSAKRSYDVFVLEPGTKLSLITQRFMEPQPALTITQNSQIFLSKTISKISEPTCQTTSTSRRMECVIDKIQSVISTTGISCLPFQFSNVFPILFSKFPPCKNDSTLSATIFTVQSFQILASTTV